MLLKLPVQALAVSFIGTLPGGVDNGDRGSLVQVDTQALLNNTSAAKITRMATDTDKLLSHIRALSDEEKIRLLDTILTDLDTPDPEIDEIWANEAPKRWESYKEGKLETVSYEDLIRRYKS
jgi:hypothetical protein